MPGKAFKLGALTMTGYEKKKGKYIMYLPLFYRIELISRVLF